MQHHDDFDFEHSPGIPAPLPPGEHVVWQGRPDKWEMAKNAFHVRKIAVYFVLILTIQWMSGAGSDDASGVSLPTTIMLSVLGITLLGVLAWLTAHVTVYTVTNKRVLIRFGVALQMTINLPFTQISAADMRVGKNGFGDIPLTLKDARRVSYPVLWPHVRPWCFSQPQPMLRCIAHVEQVATIIGQVASNAPLPLRQPSAKPSRSGVHSDSPLMGPEAI